MECQSWWLSLRWWTNKLTRRCTTSASLYNVYQPTRIIFGQHALRILDDLQREMFAYWKSMRWIGQVKGGWELTTVTDPHFYIYLILSYFGTLISREGWEKWHCSISGTEQGRESRQKAGKTVKRGTSEENLFNTSFLPPHPQTPVQSWTHLCILLFFLNLFKINCILFLFWIFLHSIVLNCKKRSSQINVAPWKE